MNSNAIVKVSVRDSRIVRNSNIGLSAQSTAVAAAMLSASNNIVSNNYAGIAVFSAGAKTIASGNTVTGNGGNGFFNLGATFESAGNNTVHDNDAGNTYGIITTIGNI
jgi:parallel beta-helix repeat protein